MPNDYPDITDQIAEDQDIGDVGGGGNGTDTTQKKPPLPGLEQIVKPPLPGLEKKNGGAGSIVGGITPPVGTQNTSPSKSQSTSTQQEVGTKTILYKNDFWQYDPADDKFVPIGNNKATEAITDGPDYKTLKRLLNVPTLDKSQSGSVVGQIVPPTKPGAVFRGFVDATTPTIEESQKLAQQNYLDKKLTYADIGWLKNTSFGKDNGLDVIFDKTGGDIHKLKYFADLHNSPKISDDYSDAEKLANENVPEVAPMLQNADAATISKAKDAILNNLTRKKNEIESKYQTSEPTQQLATSVDDQRQINQINSDIEKTQNTFATLATYADIKKYGSTDLGSSTVQSIGKTYQQNTTPASWFNKLETVEGAKPNALRNLAEVDKLEKENGADFITKAIKSSANKILLAADNTDYHRESIGNSVMSDFVQKQLNEDILNYAKTGDPEIKKRIDTNKDILESYKEKQQDIFNKYPQAGLDQTNSLLGDKMSELFPNRLYTTPGMVDAAAADIQKDNPNFLPTMGRFVKMAKDRPSQIPLAGFSGGAKAGLYHVGKDVNSLFGLSDLFKNKEERAAETINEVSNTAIKGTSFTEPTQVLFDNEGKTYRTIPSTNYSMISWNNAARGLGKALPGLAEFILLDKGLGGAAKVVGDYGVSGINALIKDTKTAELVTGPKYFDALAGTGEVREESKLVKLYPGFERDAGLLSALYATGYNNSYNEAENLINDDSDLGDAKKHLLANLFTGLSFLSFKALGISPTAAAENAYRKAAMPDVLKLIQEKGLEGIPQKEAENLFSDVLLPKFQKLMKPGLQLGTAQVLDENARGFISTLINSKEAHIPSLKEDINTIANQVMIMGAIGLPGMISEGGKFTPTARDAFYQAGLNHEAQITKINDMVKDGTLDQQKANHLISTVKTLGEEVWKTENQTNDQGLPLSTKQRVDISLQNFRQRYAKALEEKGVIKDAAPIINEAQKNIDEVKAQNHLEEVKINEDGTVTKVEPQQVLKQEQPILPKSELRDQAEIDRIIDEKLPPKIKYDKSFELIDQLTNKPFIDPLRPNEKANPNTAKNILLKRRTMLENVLNCLTK